MRSQTHPPRTSGQRAGLDRQAVLSAARAALDADGVEGLSMRSIARRLGVSPNALYSHVDSKVDLLDAVLDDLLADIESPPQGVVDPKAGLTSVMLSTFDVLCSHSDLVPLYLARQGSRGPNAQRLGDRMDALLEDLGAGQSTPQARRALIIYTIGSAAFAPRRESASPALELAAVRDNFLSGLSWMLDGIRGGR
jgi:TetR/AcrR family transcriptional regulator, tetracycline repressor protein